MFNLLGVHVETIAYGEEEWCGSLDILALALYDMA
jgi:hypothetical protein